MIPLFFLAVAASDPPPAEAGSAAPTAEIEKLLQDCGTHKFETVVNTIVDGKPHSSKVKLCGTKGQSDAAWINTLRDAVAKVKANDKMPAELRAQIASAIDLELARLGHPDSMALVADSAPSIVKAPPVNSMASLAPRSAPASSRPLTEDYGSLPPLPDPKALVATSSAIGSILPSLPAPRMTVRCGSTDDPAAIDPCKTLGTNTVLLIQADEQLPAGTGLRFVRREDPRGQVALAAMRSGQTARIPLPHRVCDGVVRSEVRIEVTRKPPASSAGEQVVDTLGPYDLRC